MNSELIDMLTTQYVWTIQNEYVWKVKADAAVSHNNFRQFQRVCFEQIGRVSKDRGEYLGVNLAQWVVDELMRQYFEGRAEPPSDFMPWWLNQLDNLQRKTKTTLDEVEEKLNQTKETPAMNNIPFATRHEIFGQDTKTMTEPQLIEAIKKIEAEIANLGQVKTKSKKIEAKVTELKDMLASVVEVLDAL